LPFFAAIFLAGAVFLFSCFFESSGYDFSSEDYEFDAFLVATCFFWSTFLVSAAFLGGTTAFFSIFPDPFTATLLLLSCDGDFDFLSTTFLLTFFFSLELYDWDFDLAFTAYFLVSATFCFWISFLAIGAALFFLSGYGLALTILYSNIEQQIYLAVLKWHSNV